MPQPGPTPVPTKRSARRLLIHLARFAMLVGGLLVASELFFMFTCLRNGESKTLEDVSNCASVTVIFLVWVGPPYLAIRLTPVVILALVGTVFLAWRDRRRA
jgi:hypothetical protein